MKRLSLILIGLGLLGPLLAQCAQEENLIGFTYDDRSYMVVKEMKSWTDAAACAVELGGYLVHINDGDEQKAVVDGILDSAGIAVDYVTIFNGGGIAYVWIGATDQHEEGKWIWDGDGDDEGEHFWSGQGANGAGDGSPQGDSYVKWGGTGSGTANEPDDYGGPGQDHGAIGLTSWPDGSGVLGAAGEWNDIVGSSEIYFVVEFDTLLTSGSSHELQHASAGSVPNIYPNPARNILHVEAADLLSLEIVDLYGRRLLHSGPAREISLSGLHEGLYTVNFYTSRGRHSELLLIR